MHEAIKRQTPEQQQVAEMLIDDVPYSKMSHKLDCTENTVRGRIFRLRHNLKVAN
jgi:DNA-directed RNA polymerase specialized sigma24 family protein